MEQTFPSFSIIIPTYGRPARLRRCLQAISQLEYPSNKYEVIVVNDDLDHVPSEVVAGINLPCELQLLTQPHAGPAAARNHGARRAKGDYLVFTDDDCEPSARWLRHLALASLQTPGCAVAGRTSNALTDNLYSTASQMLIDYLFGYYNDEANCRFLTSNNLAVPRDGFLRIGGFNTLFERAAGEDRDFGDLWMRHGAKAIFAAEAIVSHCHSLTLRTFFRQHFNYGRGAYTFHRLRAQRGAGRIEVEPLRFYAGLIGYPLGVDQPAQTIILASLMLVSQLANMSGFVVEYISRRGWTLKTTRREG